MEEQLVWVVLEDPSGSEFGNGVLGVYSTREAAEAYAASVPLGAWVGEYIVDYRLLDHGDEEQVSDIVWLRREETDEQL